MAAPFLLSPAAADTPLTVLVSNQTVPAGALAQVQFILAKPQAIASGELALEFDPSVFAGIGNVTALSAAGDAYGFASLNGVHVDVHFWSQSGGIGRVSGNPITGVSPSSGPVSVSIGGIDAFVQYAGQAPGAVTGLYQINAVVPTGVTTGDAVPLLISAGPIASLAGFTITVQ